jgi:hypothetical protein
LYTATIGGGHPGAASQERTKARREDLEGHPNWIIDVRGSGGGSDSSYQPLMPWLMPDEMASAGAEMLATPANIEVWTRSHGCAERHRGPTSQWRTAAR